MASDNKLELVIEVQADKANAQIKGVNQSLAGIERIAVSVAKNASEGIDGMTASMVKGSLAGNLLAEAIKGAAESVKKYVAGAVEMAAHNERLLIGTQVLAKARGLDAKAAREQIEAIKQIGYTTENATEIINRMLVAGQNLQRSQALAKVAKDLYAAGIGTSPAETVEKMLLAIETGQSRGLRSLGLWVDLTTKQEIAALRAGRALSEEEKSTVAYNAIMQKTSVALGTTAAAAENAETKHYNLGLAMHDLKEKIGEEFQPEYKKFIDTMMDATKSARGHADVLKMVAEVVVVLGGALAVAAVGAKIAAIAAATQGLVIALAANPFAMIALGAAAAGVAVYTMWQRLQEANDALGEQIKLERTWKAVQEGKTPDQMKAMGIDEKDVRKALSGGGEPLPGQEPWKAPKNDFGVTIKGLPSPPGESSLASPEDDARLKEQLELANEIRKKQMEATREAREALISTIGDAAGPIAKALTDVQKLTDRLTTFVDKAGKERRIELTPEAQQALTLDRTLRLGKAVREELRKYGEVQEKLWEQEQQRITKRFEYEAQYASERLEDSKKLYQFEEERAGFERDAALRQLETADAQTLPQKLAVEQRKAEIEIAYAQKAHQVKMTLFEIETNEVLTRAEIEARAAHLNDEQIKQRLDEIRGDRKLMTTEMDEAFGAQVTAARENAAIVQANLVKDHYRSIFQSLKEQAGGVFDALLTKSQSVFSAIGNALKTAILTAIKDVVTSRVAAFLTQLVTGQKVTFAQGGMGGGTLGSLAGIIGLGAQPVFGAGGAALAPTPAGTGGVGGALGSGSVFNNPLIFSAAGTPVLFGGTGGASQAGGAAGRAVGGVGPAGSTIASKAGLAGMWGNFKSSLTGIGNIGKAFSTAHGGYTGMAGGAMLAGGATLAMLGLQRGGLSGLGMTTASGALAGAKFGGPIGALIGGAIGLGLGIARLFMKSATEKVRDKIRATYGVDIKSKDVLEQIVQIAKQNYGGNYDMAIRSKEVQDMVSLYAEMTGQNARNMPKQMTPVNLLERGGSVYQMPTMQNGMPLPTSGGGLLPTIGLDRVSAGMATSGGATVIQLDGPATVKLLRGEAVTAIQGSPRTVQAATIRATKSNVGRRSMLALQVSPGTLTS